MEKFQSTLMVWESYQSISTARCILQLNACLSAVMKYEKFDLVGTLVNLLYQRLFKQIS